PILPSRGSKLHADSQSELQPKITRPKGTTEKLFGLYSEINTAATVKPIPAEMFGLVEAWEAFGGFARPSPAWEWRGAAAVTGPFQNVIKYLFINAIIIMTRGRRSIDI